MEKNTDSYIDPLIESCKSGDQRAMMQVYDKYYQQMYHTAYQICGRDDVAEDQMQEAFLSAFQKLDHYDGRAGFASWLKRIVINRCLDELKSRKQWLPIDEHDGTYWVDSWPEENLQEIREIEVEKIRQAIRELAVDKRIIISLYLLEGYDHEEIAEILGITYAAARTRYSRAKKELLELLELKKSRKGQLK